MNFRDQVIYQVYPKSFSDSNADGFGDLRGIIGKVPYIASLGVDMVWFNPFFLSPQKDNGYDVADYYAIDPSMGTMEDVEKLIAALAEHGVGVMFDMVFNHVPTEHEWFQRALAGERKYMDFFYLQPLQEDGSLPTNWESKFGGPAWAPLGDAVANPALAGENGEQLYYLHLYDTTQADLNWHNPEVRAELHKVVNFWLEKGVRGFRFDVLNVIGKEPLLADAPEGVVDKTLYTDTPQVHPWIQEMAEATYGRYEDTVTVGEMSSTTIENSVGYTNPANRELDMVFSFHHLKVDYVGGQKWSVMPFDFQALKILLNDWALGMSSGGGWNAVFLNNHDQPRALNRFGDPVNYRAESATMLANTIHLTRGTPYVYQGEEIGMVDPVYTGMGEYMDVEAHNAFAALTASGMDEDEAFSVVRTKARDNSRTPMQWDGSEGAGFTVGTPWLKPTSQEEINVEAEESGGVILAYYRKLIRLRKEMPLISEGLYEPFAMEHESVYGYIRRHEGQALLVLNNFYGEQAEVGIPEEFRTGSVLIDNYDGRPQALSTEQLLSGSIRLAPYQALAVLI